MLTTGQRIKKLRELRSYSQVYMARKLGISQEQYSYLENRQKYIPEEQVKMIAALLGVNEDQLRTFDPQNMLDSRVREGSEGYLRIQNLLIQNHENERKLFVELIARLEAELAELKQKIS